MDFAYLLQDQDGKWVYVSGDQSLMAQACAADNPLHIPTDVLDGSDCRVS